MNEDIERIQRLKRRIVPMEEIYLYIGLLIALRLSLIHISIRSCAVQMERHSKTCAIRTGLFWKSTRNLSLIHIFNRTYKVSVPEYKIDEKKLPMGFRPVYDTYVDVVIEHLGGKSFRETAVEELLARLNKVVRPAY